MKNMRSAIIAAAIISATFAGTGLSAQGPSHHHATADAEVPAQVIAAATAPDPYADPSDENTGHVAAARIGSSDLYVTYVQGPNRCGSGGCVAHIWEMNGQEAVERGTLQVGFLPFYILPQVDNGMPRLAIVSRTASAGVDRVPLVIAYDGTSYDDYRSDEIINEEFAHPLLTDDMFRPF